MLKSILLLSDYCSKNLRLWGPLCSRDRQRAMMRNLKRTENRDFNIYLVHYVPWQQTWQVISLSATEQENWCGVVSCVIWKQKIEDSELTESIPCVKQYWARHLHRVTQEMLFYFQLLRSDLSPTYTTVQNVYYIWKCNLFPWWQSLIFSSHYSSLKCHMILQKWY